MTDRRGALLQSVLLVDPKVDWTTLPLDAREGFVLSRIDGTCNVQTLGTIVGMRDEEVVAVVEKLLSLRVVLHKNGAPVTIEQVDLSEEQQERIHALAEALPKLTHYDVLKLTRSVAPGDIKPAYYAFSKEYHPDRFYGKQLGSYKAMIERIFMAGKTAYELLTDATARAQYDKSLPKDAPVTINPTLNDTEAKRAALEAHRQKILQQRKAAQKNPFKEQVANAKGHADEGEAFFRKGDVVNAVAKFSLALAFDPANEGYQRRFAELQPLANEKRALSLAEHAAAEQKNGNFSGAAALYRQAYEVQPGNGVYANRAAELYFAQGSDLMSARELAEAAVERAPKNPEYRLTLAQVCEKQGELVKAREALQAGLGLGLDTPESKKMSKRLK